MASTQSTASEASAPGPYSFSFSWEGPYGYSVKLLEELGCSPGLVLDLGCGNAAIADPLIERGFGYVGVDLDAEALASVARCGHETHELDMRSTELTAQILKVVGERQVAAVFALDLLEHLTELPLVLRKLHAALDQLGRPPLILSVPNVAHVDLGAKLVFGMWDDRPTGLLDRTHVNFFTATRLQREMRAAGFLELAARDFQSEASDQHFPEDHPALASGSPVADLIGKWRNEADNHGCTVQFVRAFVAADLQPTTLVSDRPASVIGDTTKQLTVVLRTQGRRLTSLCDVLTCLAAQTADTFDVLLMVHSDDEQPLDDVAHVLAEFDHSFVSRVSIVAVPARGGRARPLNAALERATSAYVAFLDDDDLVTANWVEAFCAAAGDCAVVRSQSAARWIDRSPDPDRVPFVPRTGLEFRFAADFDLAQHLWQNQTPICSYAVPRALIEAFGLRFDEQFVVLEDWSFLLRCASLARVRDTGVLTSIVHLWSDDCESSRSLHLTPTWKALERLQQDQLNAAPLLLPPGSAAQLIDLHDRQFQLQHENRQLEATLRVENRRLASELEQALRNYDLVVGSARWRVLGPPLRAVARMRGKVRDSLPWISSKNP